MCSPAIESVGVIRVRPLGSCIQHVFDEDAVASCGIIHKNMGNGSNKLAVLDNGAAAHECDQ